MDAKFYRNNRKKLMKSLEQGSAVILFSGAAPKKSADGKYPYTPNRNFLYMSGVADQNLILYMARHEDGLAEYLFIPEYDEHQAKWFGASVSPADAAALSGIRDIKFTKEFEQFIHKEIKTAGTTVIGFDLEKDSFMADQSPGGKWARLLKNEYPEVTVKNIYPQIAQARVIKTPGEVDNIRKAIAITKKGIARMMKNAAPGQFEFELEAEFNYELKKAGVKDLAFPTILASGRNATVLHYDTNDSKIGGDDLVLMDLGAAWNFYSADITRTFPISGRFTPRQRILYDIVLKAHGRVIELIVPGRPFAELNEAVKEVYAQELTAIGLIADKAEVVKYYFHGVSHYLGLDTHDVGSRETVLQAGMVITVEPGLYLPEEGIGIRIEDDVLVTKDGHEVLSRDIIRTPDDIEEFLRMRE